MGFARVQQKSGAYHKRYQVKFRRRREGRTDYYARQRLTFQDKNKYNSPKYRLVVRFSNSRVTVQVAYATIKGDITVAAAYSDELPKYGAKVGLTNWAATYATGLLAARRTLAKFGLDEKYAGNTNIDGNYFNVEDEYTEGARPFTANLDVGIKRTTTGSKVFAALKGAADGGLNVPHSESRFPGWDPESKELDAETLKGYIFGEPVAEYMRYLQENNKSGYEKHFARYIKAGIKADDVQGMWEKVHAAIRKDPVHKATDKKKDASGKRWKGHPIKMSLQQRRDSLRQRYNAKVKAAAAAAE